MTVPPEGGVLPLDKPVGPTSHDVVAQARRALGTRRIGHTGTLDPFASGLLLLVVGPATRLSAFLSGADKGYVAEARLGISTDTLDREGEVLAQGDGWQDVAPTDVERAMAPWRGEVLQVPPAFSAKRIGGERAHRRARRGEPVDLPGVPVTVHELELIELDPPHVRFRVRCSSGTFVRALARDVGEGLGCGAHLSALRRTSVGPFEVARALRPEQLADDVPDRWITPAEALAAVGLALVRVGEDDVRRVTMGQSVPVPEADLPEGSEAAIVDDEGLVAVAEVRDEQLLPRRVFRAT